MFKELNQLMLSSFVTFVYVFGEEQRDYEGIRVEFELCVEQSTQAHKTEIRCNNRKRKRHANAVRQYDSASFFPSDTACLRR